VIDEAKKTGAVDIDEVASRFTYKSGSAFEGVPEGGTSSSLSPPSPVFPSCLSFIYLFVYTF
jgi:hypothetical protein